MTAKVKISETFSKEKLNDFVKEVAKDETKAKEFSEKPGEKLQDLGISVEGVEPEDLTLDKLRELTELSDEGELVAAEVGVGIGIGIGVGVGTKCET